MSKSNSCHKCPKRSFMCHTTCIDYFIDSLLNEINKERLREFNKKRLTPSRAIWGKNVRRRKTMLSTHKR